MLILLYGSDTYRSSQKLNEIIEYYKKTHQKRGLNLQYFDGKDLNYQEFKEQVFSKTIFKGKKLLVTKNAFLNKGFKEEFLREADQFIDNGETILFYEKETIPGNDPLLQLFEKKGKVEVFEPLGRQKLKNWAKKEFQKNLLQIEPKALEKLITDTGNNLWQLSNEIKKLVCYKRKGKIGLRDVELLVEPGAEVNIFRTIDAIAEGNKKRALQLINLHLARGDSPSYLLAMVIYQFRNLLLVKSNQLCGKSYNADYYGLGRKLNLHPYLIKKTLWQARKFSLEQLKKIYRKIFTIDLKIKTGKFSPETGLEMLIAEL